MQSALNRLRRRLAIVSVALLLPTLATGCFGSFQLVRKVYGFNAQVHEDKWVKEGVFLLLNIPFVPVYSLAAAVDALFLNSVEFWTGENPLLAGTTRTVEGRSGEVVSATFREDGSVDVVIIEPAGTRHTLTLVREGDGLSARHPDGRLIARVQTIEGRPTLVEPHD